MFINCIQRQEQKPPQLFIRILLPMIITIVTLISSIIFILELNGANVSADEQRSLSLLNASNKKIEVHWIESGSGKRHLMSDPHINEDEVLSINTYVGENFEIDELPSERSGECGNGRGDKQCRVSYISIGDADVTIYKLNTDFEIVEGDEIESGGDEIESGLASKSANFLTYCKGQAMIGAPSVGDDVSLATNIMDEFKKCLELNVVNSFVELDQEITFQAKSRENMSTLLENHTCADQMLPTNAPKEVRYWHNKGDVKEVIVLVDRNSSKVHVIKDFISEEECNAMGDEAEGKLHSATVASEDGGSRLTETRKAMQAGIRVPWDKESQGHPIAVLSRRVFEYTNNVTGFDIDEFGQEDLMSIQYNGRGVMDKAPDRYMPHCDGDCTGSTHKVGGRVATMVMYCTIPEIGGATNFMNSGVHVVARKGYGVFFSYMNSDKVMDKGFTQHSGCPVISGSKKIVTQWIRDGVDNESPWNAFNTLGIKYTDAAQD